MSEQAAASSRDSGQYGEFDTPKDCEREGVGNMSHVVAFVSDSTFRRREDTETTEATSELLTGIRSSFRSRRGEALKVPLDGAE